MELGGQEGHWGDDNELNQLAGGSEAGILVAPTFSPITGEAANCIWQAISSEDLGMPSPERLKQINVSANYRCDWDLVHSKCRASNVALLINEPFDPFLLENERAANSLHV